VALLPPSAAACERAWSLAPLWEGGVPGYGHHGVKALTIAPSGEVLAVGDGVIWVYTSEDGALLGELPGCEGPLAIGFARPDAATALCPGEGLSVSLTGEIIERFVLPESTRLAAVGAGVFAVVCDQRVEGGNTTSLATAYRGPDWQPSVAYPSHSCTTARSASTATCC